MITVEKIDTSRLSDRMIELNDALIGAGQRGDAATIFEDESRRFVEGVARITPPKNRQQGEKAVEKDLRRLFVPVNEALMNVVGSEHGISNIDAWITTSAGEKKHLDWRRIDPSGEGMRDYHYSNKNKRGRTLKRVREVEDRWFAPYVVSFEDFKRYADKIKARVGRRRAGWAKSILGLGGKVGSWISRHLAGARGEFHSTLDNRLSPGVTMTNYSAGIVNDVAIVRNQVRIRAQAINRRIKLVLSGYSRDMANGLKISRKERKTPATPVE